MSYLSKSCAERLSNIPANKANASLSIKPDSIISWHYVLAIPLFIIVDDIYPHEIFTNWIFIIITCRRDHCRFCLRVLLIRGKNGSNMFVMAVDDLLRVVLPYPWLMRFTFYRWFEKTSSEVSPWGQMWMGLCNRVIPGGRAPGGHPPSLKNYITQIKLNIFMSCGQLKE